MTKRHYPSVSNSRDCEKYFKENIEELGIIKEISCAFNPSNLIFFEDEIENRSYHFVAKTYESNVLFLSGINCGYGGEGPGSYERILTFLGVDEKIAEQISYSRASKVYFDREGNYTNWECPPFYIDDRDLVHKIDPKYCDVDLKARKIYLFNSERYLDKLVEILEMLNPYRLEYWIGDNSRLDDNFRAKLPKNWQLTDEHNDYLSDYSFKAKTRKEWRERRKTRYPRATEVNIILRGEKYDVLLLLAPELQLSTLEFLHLYFLGDSFTNKNYESVYNYLPKLYWFDRLFRQKDSVNYLEGSINLGGQRND